MASQSAGNLKKLKLYICTLGLRSSKVFVSSVKILFQMFYA